MASAAPSSSPDDHTVDPSADPSADGGRTPDATPAPPEVPLLELSDGLTPVVETPEALARTVEALRAGTGPLAVDAERASGYRYSARAYLVQLRREGSGTHLVDPIAFDDLTPLAEVMAEVEWILHAANQDLPCLAEIGLRPPTLFDTELAGRLLGYPRVGLATLVEEIVGYRLRKEHSAVDWSTRPLPEPWLEYAALDVEVLVELRERLGGELEETGKAEWARQEFAALVAAGPPTPRVDPWRRTSGMHRARGRRALAAVRAMWQTRDEIASRRDVTPGRIIPDSAIVEAANALPQDKGSLLGLKGFRGRGAQRYAARWLDALGEARGLDDQELPPLAGRLDGPPPPRAWADRDPVAAARLRIGRESLTALADELSLPTENLITPDTVRRVLWEPPEDDDLGPAVADRLGALGAREWQVELATPALVDAITRGPEVAMREAARESAQQPTQQGSPESSRDRSRR